MDFKHCVINYQFHSDRLMKIFLLKLKVLRETFITITSPALALSYMFCYRKNTYSGIIIKEKH